MPSLQDQLYVLFPNASQPGDYLLQDDGRGDGPYIKIWNLQAPQPTPDQLATITQQQVDVARMIAKRAAATQAALSSVEAADIASRTDAKLQWTTLNDHAEILGYIMDKLGINKDQFVADITKKRSDWITSGGKFEQEPTDPAVMYNELTRLAQSMIVQALGTAIIQGVGDPIKV